MNKAQRSYEVRARNRSGEVSKLYLEADSTDELYEEIARRHLVALEVRENIFSRLFALSLRPKVKKTDVRDLFFQMATYLEAGLPLERLLHIVSKRERNNELRSIMSETHRGVRSGKHLSELLQQHSMIFPSYATAAIRAGEESGNLAETLFEVAKLLDKHITLKDSILSALIYPAILLATGTVSIFLIIYFAVPRFAQVFADMGKEMPFLLDVMFGISNHFWITATLLILFVVGGAGGIAYMLQQHKERHRIDALLLRLPWVGPLITMFQMTLFFRTFGTALRSALPTDRALELANSILNNVTIKDVFASALADVRKGGRFVSRFENVSWMPEVAVNLMGLAEESGSMDEMSLKVAGIMEENLDKRLKALTAVIEPLLILCVSVVIGGVVISLLYSLFSINF